MSNRGQRTAWAAACALITVLLTACAGPSAQVGLTAEQVRQIGQDQAAAGHANQAEALSDGAVTKAEYTKASEDITECITGLGYPPPDVQVSPISGQFLIVYETANRAADVEAGDRADCEEEFWSSVSAVYQDTTPPIMDEELRIHAIKCIDDAGFELTGHETTPSEMAGADPMNAGQPSPRAQATIDCLSTAQRDLFPDIEGVAISIN